MRLSDAMMLGSVTLKMERGNWNSCALGVAGNAVGIPNWGNVGRDRYKLILARWPWLQQPCSCGEPLSFLSHDFASHIFICFDGKVVAGDMTLEQLIDWVRSVEPKPLGLPAPAVSESVEAVKELMAAL